jgi:peptidoglycan/LPS O-acetylase OafA/YrhL
MDRTNNFDLLRLLAAVQVLYFHALEHLRLDGAGLDGITTVLGWFPGVPIFFVISGFLITASYLNNRDRLGQYVKNRLLRIFPALIVCTTLTTVVLVFFGHVAADWRMVAWFAGQLGVLPIYNPEFLRGFGVGMPNGALWTIPVELQFYAFVPLFFMVLAVLGVRESGRVWALVWVLLLSFVVYLWYGAADRTPLWMQVFYISVLPHLWMFLLGSVAYLIWPHLKGALQHYGLTWLVVYLAWCAFFAGDDLGISGMFIQKVLMACCVLAFSMPKVAHTLLGRNDISYGVYLYHMPVINVCVTLGWVADWRVFGVIVSVTGLLAWLSWRLVERPALARKQSNTAFAPAAALR